MSLLTFITPSPLTETVEMAVACLLIRDRLVDAQFRVEVRHQPAQTCRASRCYCDSPPDPAETSVVAVSVIGWQELADDGSSLPRLLSEQQVAAAAMNEIVEQVEARYA